MKKTIGFLIIAVILIFLALGIARTREKEAVMSIKSIQEQEGVPVEVEAVGRRDVTQTRSYFGDIQAGEQAVITAKLGERLDKLLVKEGQSVRLDQPLASFDTTVSQSGVAQARLALENARKDLQRVETLLNQGAISRQAYDGAKLQFDIACQNYETARSAVVMSAPVAGVVIRVDCSEGDYVHFGDPIMTIQSGKSLEVEFDVSLEDRPYIRPGQEIRIKVGKGELLSGKINRVALATGKESRLFKAYASLPASDRLWPGVMAEVEVTLADHRGVLAVPVDAVVERDRRQAVFVVENNHARLTPVELGIDSENYVEIVSGLQEGQLVSVYGHKDLTDGVKVKVVK